MTLPGSQFTQSSPGLAAARLECFLTQNAANARPLTAGDWEFHLKDSRRRARVQVDRDWLRLSSRLRVLPRDLDSALIDSSLRTNARMKGAARITGEGSGRTRYVAIDLPTDSLPSNCQNDFDNLIETLLANLAQTFGRPCHDPAADITQAGMLSDEQLESAFSFTEWPLQRLEAGQLAVPLEISGDHFAAELEQTDTGLRICVPLYVENYRNATAECRSAFCVLLWLTCNRSRMVKAALTRRQPWIEVFLPRGLIDATAIAHGCGALVTTLHRLVREAVLLLTDEKLARLFLEVVNFKHTERVVSPRSAISLTD